MAVPLPTGPDVGGQVHRTEADDAELAPLAYVDQLVAEQVVILEAALADGDHRTDRDGSGTPRHRTTHEEGVALPPLDPQGQNSLVVSLRR